MESKNKSIALCRDISFCTGEQLKDDVITSWDKYDLYLYSLMQSSLQFYDVLCVATHVVLTMCDCIVQEIWKDYQTSALDLNEHLDIVCD